MNDDNLRRPSPIEARENGRKGGIASGKARRKKADMRRLMSMMLEEGSPGDDATYAQKLTASMLSIAGDPKQGAAAVRAYETILHIIGQDEPEPEQGAIDVLRSILEDNRKNAEGVQPESETT